MANDLIKRLRKQHDEMNCNVLPMGSGFKTASERENEHIGAADLCWQAADEIERLRAIEQQANDLLCWRYQQALNVEPHEATRTVRDLHPGVYNIMDVAEQRLWEMLYYPGGGP